VCAGLSVDFMSVWDKVCRI